MNKIMIYPAGNTPALTFACQYLQEQGVQILSAPAPDATHLLLSAPAFEADHRIRGGGILEHLLTDLPEDITVIGGNLNHPALKGYRQLDLLKDARYLAHNAAITAHCAMALAADRLPVTFSDCRVLVIGWGRIGKCLAKLLRAVGASVTVAARKETDRAMAAALGYDTADTAALTPRLEQFRLIFNTAPEEVMDARASALCKPECVKIDLASQRGIGGNGVIWARGLPGIHAPESSGALIAQSVIRLISGKEETK